MVTFILTLLVVLQSDANIEKKLSDAGLVDISTMDNSILIKLLYSTTDNFTGKDLYGSLERAYMMPEIADMVCEAQRLLENINPDYSLIIYDAARPMSVQKYMHDLVAGTPQHIYVANPAKGGGKHNYGVAVDLSIIDKNGKVLDMGSGFDHFGEESHVGNEADMVAKGLITQQAADNRAILTEVMTKVGFRQHPKEWWHFDKYTTYYLKNNFEALNF